MKSKWTLQKLKDYEPVVKMRWYCRSCGKRIRKNVYKVLDPFDQIENFKWTKGGVSIKFFGYCCKFCYDIRKLRNDR